MKRWPSLAGGMLLLALSCAPAPATFDFSRYKPADLDALLKEPLPKDGADIFPQIPLRINGTLTAYGEPCPTGFLKRAMLMAGIPQQAIDAVPMSRCIKLRSTKGQEVQLYIQDALSDSLHDEVALGQPVTLFVLRLFAGPKGPGLLVNEFSADRNGPTKK